MFETKFLFRASIRENERPTGGSAPGNRNKHRLAIGGLNEIGQEKDAEYCGYHVGLVYLCMELSDVFHCIATADQSKGTAADASEAVGLFRCQLMSGDPKYSFHCSHTFRQVFRPLLLLSIR